MNIKRRDFFKGCAAAACVLAVPGIAMAAKGANNAPALAAVEKSIKASFGGGFSVESHSQSGKLTHATIENFGNRYAVTSTDLLDWKIVAPSK